MLISPSISRRLTVPPEMGDPEIAELKWSLGVVSGRIVLRESRWKRLRYLFRKRSLEENLGVAGADAFISVRAPDDATIEIFLKVVNFSGRDVLIEHIGSDWLGISSGFVSTSGPVLLPSATPIQARSIRGLTIRFAVLPAGVRDLSRLVRQGTARRSSPDARLHWRGSLIASQRSLRAPIQIEVHVPTPAIDWAATMSLD
jgi:hypothetical protein